MNATERMTTQQKIEYFKQQDRNIKARKKQEFKDKIILFKEGVIKVSANLKKRGEQIQQFREKKRKSSIQKYRQDIELETLKLKKAQLKKRRTQISGTGFSLSNSPFKLK